MAPILPVNHVPEGGSRLVYFDYFRAFTILMIVLGHCYTNWPSEPAWKVTAANIITGNSTLFVFISGFFFYHVYFPKYHYWSFVKHKTKNVFAPYLILSLLYIVYYYLVNHEIVMAKVIDEFYGPNLNNFQLVILNFLTGRTLQAYWYVPFAMLLFLLSPVFIRFIQLSLKAKVLITGSLFVLSMFVQRSTWQINTIHNLIYFTPFYLLGITYSMESTSIISWLKDKVWVLLGITVAIAFAMYLSGQNGAMEKTSIFMWHGVDLMIFQKISLIAFMLAFTMTLQRYQIPFLITTANMSFAYYFLHSWVLSFIHSTGTTVFQHGFTGVLLLFTVTMIFSYLIARTVKCLLGKKSRYIIGW